MAERKWLEQLIAYDGECFRNSQECSRCDVYNKDEHCTRVAALENAKVLLAEMNKPLDRPHQAVWLIEHEGACTNRSWNCFNCICSSTMKNSGHCVESETLKTARDFISGISSITTFNRDDLVLANGKQWRVDYTDGPYLGLSSADSSHTEVNKSVCKKVSLVDDVLARVTMP